MTKNTLPLTGIVLAGGKSTRMGSDKGLMIAKTGIPWAKHLAGLLSDVCSDIYISVREEQINAYKAFFPEKSFITDRMTEIGPAAGIISCALQFPEKHLLIVSCDMIMLDNRTILDLQRQYHSHPGHEFYGYKVNGQTNPFPGIYSPHFLENFSARSEMHNNSLVKTINESDAFLIKKGHDPALASFNTMDQITDISKED